MVFGEIVEPSTRALIIDEDEEYVDHPNDYSFNLEWEGLKTVPEVINSLIFVESAPLLTLLKSKSFRCYGAIKDAKVRVFMLENDDYLVISNVPETFTQGEIAENFVSWVEKAQNVYCITSKPQPLFVKQGITENLETFVRSITYKNAKNFNCPKLESPNLLTGTGAAIMSLCIFKDIACALFVVFVPSAPLDSVTAVPIVDLLRKLNVCQSGDLKINVGVPSNNLYM